MRLSADHLSLLPSLLLHHTFRHCDDGLYTHSRSIGQGQRFGNPTLVHFSGAIALRANSKTDHLKLVNIASCMTTKSLVSQIALLFSKERLYL
ncbi:hypothetical protein RRG08_022740 [Elysia crispata]|uniref:Uncharacterized protein n=1 Tax=Elysia crispata TaxID=231223 RepID=A0AAE0ZEZ9_9GAST|nr:hypothetical protein RRG08_022740 [Elysia crispata]